MNHLSHTVTLTDNLTNIFHLSHDTFTAFLSFAF